MQVSRSCSKSFQFIFILTFFSVAIADNGFSFQVERQARQQKVPRTEIVARTITVAVTEITFETMAKLCAELVNATRPCIGRQVNWQRIPTNSEAVNPTLVQQVIETTTVPATSRLNDRDLEITSVQQLMSSLKEPEEENGRESQRQAPSFIRRLTFGFSNALGLARTLVSTFTETKTMTTTYTETIGYNTFYISECIPPIMYYPVCKSSTSDSLFQ